MGPDEVQAGLPLWKCHKKVYASKITAIVALKPEGYRITLEDGNVRVANAWVAKHFPMIGGYFVQYADGYESFSPAEAFERGYTKIEGGE